MKVYFNVRVCVASIGTSGNDVYVWRDAELPFAPFEGLSVIFPDGEEFIIPNRDDYADGGVLGGLSYDVLNGVFNVVKYDHASRVATTTLKQRVQDWVDSGWRLTRD